MVLYSMYEMKKTVTVSSISRYTMFCCHGQDFTPAMYSFIQQTLNAYNASGYVGGSIDAVMNKT